MQQGMLLQTVLRKLAERPHTGYALCKGIEEETGRRPSFGSIYPLLERLAKERKVTVRNDGRRKEYRITPEGKKAHERMREHHAEIVDHEMARIKQVAGLLEMDPAPILAILERAKRGEAPLGPVTANMFRFRDLRFTMAQDGRAARHAKEINTMLDTTIKRLERMR